MRGVLGLLRTSEERLLGRGARFVLTGCIVSAVYLITTTLLASVFGVPFQIALPIGFCTGVAVHFTLQRSFVWVHSSGFALAFRHQAVRYVLAAAFQYGLTAATTSLLPSRLGVSTELVYVTTVVAVSLLNFAVFGRLVFHGSSVADELVQPAPAGARQAEREVTAPTMPG